MSLDRSTLLEHLLGAIERDELALPVLPEVATRLNELLHDPNVSAREVTAVISGDVAIAAHLLKVANSATFADKPKVEQVPQAISRLGYIQVHNLVTQFAVSNMLKTSNPTINQYLQDFWTRSREVAALSHALTKVKRQLNADQAMFAGIIHDIGILPMCLYVDQQRAKITAEELDDLAARCKKSISLKLLHAWNFPDTMMAVVSEEYRTDNAGNYGDIVKVASLMQRNEFEQTDWANLEAAQRLELDEFSCRNFAVKFAGHIKFARGLLGMKTQEEEIPEPAAAQATPPAKRRSTRCCSGSDPVRRGRPGCRTAEGKGLPVRPAQGLPRLTRHPHQHQTARLAAGAVDGRQRTLQIDQPHPRRRVFVLGDIQDQHPIRPGIVSRECRPVPTAHLAEHPPEIVGQHELAIRSQRLPQHIAESVGVQRIARQRIGFHAMQGERVRHLLPRHALPQHGLRANELRDLSTEKVVLCEESIGRVDRLDRLVHRHGIQHGDRTGDRTEGLRLLDFEHWTELPEIRIG